MAVWRLQVNTGGANIADYCIKNHIAAMGWSLDKLSSDERKQIKSFSDYCKLAETQYESFHSVRRLAREVKTGDLLWMRSEGKYYFARVRSDSVWIFNEDAIGIDAANQLTNIRWYLATEKADEESVPGAISTAFIRGATLQRISKPGVEEYSQMLFNQKHDTDYDSFSYPSPNLCLCEKHFYSLLQPDDVEDLLSLWLYVSKGYICIPSTNKNATPKYECVLVDPSDHNRKHIYIQVKKGNVDLNAADYAELFGDVYLLTTEGRVINADKFRNIYDVSPTDIYQFAISADNAHIIPENVLYWVKFLTDIENFKLDLLGCKGIMFDTNNTYSDTNETEMIMQNKISAYGDAKRYVDRFNKGDYALFYSKGKGIIAIGKIISDAAKEIGNEKYHDVDMLVPKNFKGNTSEMYSLSPIEIKKILGRNFYWASTIKTPYLSKEQIELLIDELNRKYS